MVKNEIKENNTSDFQKDIKIQDNPFTKIEKNDCYKITKFNIFFLYNKKTIIEIEKENTISFQLSKQTMEKAI